VSFREAAKRDLKEFAKVFGEMAMWAACVSGVLWRVGRLAGWV